MPGTETTDTVDEVSRDVLQLAEPWPELARGAEKAMNPSRGAIIGISIGCGMWLMALLFLFLALRR